MNKWAVGLYKFYLTVTQPKLHPLPTNSVFIALAPQITFAPKNAVVGDVNMTVTCTPRLLPDQIPKTILIFGSRPINPASVTNPIDTTQPTTLTFKVPAVKAGEYFIRLRVDGIDSMPVTVSPTSSSLDLDQDQKVVVA